MAGAAIARRLQKESCNVITVDRASLDLTRQGEVEAWMTSNKPQVIVVAAARVGGIHANNSYPVEFLSDNLAISLNVIDMAAKIGVEKLLFLGSSCIYPRDAKQPIAEDQLMTGSLEPTNEWYAIAKIAGLKLCAAYRLQHRCDFISVMPTNLYGPGDNFDLETSHVPAALLRRFDEAKQRGDANVSVWGTGSPRREFLYVEDMADACVHILKRYSGSEIVNIGTGDDISISEFANLIKEVVGFKGQLTFDRSKPDGMPLKRLDVSRLSNLGWNAKTSLRDGLQKTYDWYQEAKLRGQLSKRGIEDKENFKESRLL